MPLHRPTLGDILDRLTILELKILWKGKNWDPILEREQWQAAVGHFIEERDALLADFDLLMGLILQLAAVNAGLWQLTDELHEVEEGHDELNACCNYAPGSAVIAEMGLQMLRWNDTRARIVGEINKKEGRAE